MNKALSYIGHQKTELGAQPLSQTFAEPETKLSLLTVNNYIDILAEEAGAGS